MPDNELLDELKRRIAEDSVVFVVGSGVSVQATGNAPCASWTGLLRHGIDYAVGLGLMTEPVANLTRQQIDSGDLDLLLAAAQIVRSKLGNDFRAWLQDSVGKLTVKHPEVINALHSIGAPLATTNYDHLLGGPAIPWKDGAAVEETLKGHRKAVVHLHGDFDHPDSVILDLRSYEEVKASSNANAILYAIRTLKTLVFVGCGDGLADPHFEAFFRWTEKAFFESRFRHFILCRDSDVESLRQKHLPERKLYPLPYGAKHEELPAFLRTLVRDSRKNEEPAPAESPTAIEALPDPGPCFGRETEVAAIVEALLAEAPTRIAVLGTGGIGKTTVTLTAVRDRQVAARFNERRFFVRCDAATNRDGLVSAIATHLGITSGGQLSSAVLKAVASAPAILVLDNFETPWQSATIEVEEFLALLSGMDSLQLIVTMRGIERPAGVLWRDPIEPPRLPLLAARKAFLAIATRFADDPQLDELLEAMDRFPLAIALLAHVAQRATHLEPLLKLWDEKRTSMLQRAGGDAKATNIEVSFELSIASPRMTAVGRRLLSILAILPAGIAETDLPALLDEGETAAGVLRACGLAFDEAGRLRMLAPLRAYVRKTYPVEQANELRVIAHYLALAVRGDELGTATGAEAAVRLTPEVGNLETILILAVNRVPVSQLTNATVGYGEFARFTALGSSQVVEQITASALANHAAERARCLMELGSMAAARSPHEARDYFDAALEIYRSIGDAYGEAYCIQDLGYVALNLDELTAAESRFKEAISLHQNLNDSFDEASCIQSLGEIALKQSDLNMARERFTKALTLSRTYGNSHCEGLCARGLGDVALAESDFSTARAQFETALALHRNTGSLRGQANATLGIGRCLKSEDTNSARTKAYASIELYERVGGIEGIGDAHLLLAQLATNDHEIEEHRTAARNAYLSIHRPDLVEKIDQLSMPRR